MLFLILSYSYFTLSSIILLIAVLNLLILFTLVLNLLITVLNLLTHFPMVSDVGVCVVLPVTGYPHAKGHLSTVVYI